MTIFRSIPPAASPIYLRDIRNGLAGALRGRPEVERFREEIADDFKIKHCFLLSSGRAALTVILRALHDLHPDRGYVLIPAFGCYSVPSAIVRAGLKVRLCDIDPDTLDFDRSRLREISISSPGDLLAILPVHLFGLAADIGCVRDLFPDPGITIVEDAAQAFGGEVKGKRLGTIGDAGFFSLGRGKALSVVEGGIVLTNRDDIAAKIAVRMESIEAYSLRELLFLLGYAIVLAVFQYPRFFWLPKALPFLRLGETIYDPGFRVRKMSSFQAGMARGWKSKLLAFQKIRRERSRRWSGGSIKERNGALPDYIRFPVRIEDAGLRKNLLRESDASGLGLMFTYPDSIDGIPQLKAAISGHEYPAAASAAKQLLTLPVHPLVSPGDMEKIEALLERHRGGVR